MNSANSKQNWIPPQREVHKKLSNKPSVKTFKMLFKAAVTTNALQFLKVENAEAFGDRLRTVRTRKQIFCFRYHHPLPLPPGKPWTYVYTASSQIRRGTSTRHGGAIMIRRVKTRRRSPRHQNNSRCGISSKKLWSFPGGLINGEICEG